MSYFFLFQLSQGWHASGLLRKVFLSFRSQSIKIFFCWRAELIAPPLHTKLCSSWTRKTTSDQLIATIILDCMYSLFLKGFWYYLSKCSYNTFSRLAFTWDVHPCSVPYEVRIKMSSGEQFKIKLLTWVFMLEFQSLKKAFYPKLTAINHFVICS